MHDAAFAAHEFNASGRGDARFSPLRSLAGEGPGAAARPTLVPTLYAAATPEGALMETVLHDLPWPSDGHLHDLERDLRGPHWLSPLRITQPLRLIDLHTLGLQRLGLQPAALFQLHADRYPETRAWAAWLHQAEPQAQGLCWMSVRHGEVPACMLFGDRVAPQALGDGASPDAQGGPDPIPSRHLSHPEVLTMLLGLLDRLGCGVVPAR